MKVLSAPQVNRFDPAASELEAKLTPGDRAWENARRLLFESTAGGVTLLASSYERRLRLMYICSGRPGRAG